MRQTEPLSEISPSDPALRALADRLEAGGHTVARGAAGSSTALVAGAVASATGRAVLLVTAHLDDADEAVDELTARGADAARLPALEYLPGETALSLDLFAERLSLVRRIASGAGPGIVVAPVQSLMQPVPAAERLPSLILPLRAGMRLAQSDLVRWLDDAGYKRIDAVEEPGDFAVRGGIVDVFPPGAYTPGPLAGAASGTPIRLDFLADEIESITEIDTQTMGSGEPVPEVELAGARRVDLADDAGAVNFIETLPAGAVAIIAETGEVTEQARGYYERAADARAVWGPPAVMALLRQRCHALAEINQFGAGLNAAETVVLPVRPPHEPARDAARAVSELADLAGRQRVLVLCQNEGERARLLELLQEHAPGAPVASAVRYLHRGFVWGEGDGAICLLTYHELMHRYGARRRIRRLRAGRPADAFLEVSAGDFVVHADHGIARFIGLTTMKPRAPRPTADSHARSLLSRRAADEDAPRRPAAEEYLVLEFAGRSRLHVPVTQIDKVQRYIGGHAGKPPLSTLGGRRWQAQKEQTRASVRDLAAELLRVQAARESMPGIRFPDDTAWQREFEAAFPYQETEDQTAALAEIKKDMQTPRPMDRLLCGDVGYGKTEVAIRAVFKAVESGRQAAVLVPTTLLAEQHERTFRQRFADYPFRIESLSRFKSARQVNETLAAARKGQVDILIGTHRLLSKDVRFADLGLVVVDEEQRFGVEHKNALLALRLTVDVLTLTATPIPRTLHMAMLGLRDICSLTTPPPDRRAVVTEVIPFNEQRIARAIARELAREGQVYFVHNRVHSIAAVADEVRRLAPGARVVVGHGQMPDGELEEVMHAFVSRSADILVSTTIVESGIDIPTANTIFINNADRFGLADLHQLRGRVGRYKHRAYCYLLLPNDRPPTEVALRRLRAVEEFSMLGAGFRIAMRDLEIRGAGNLLGPQQSGHIAAVGYDMYCRLLEQAARELRAEPAAEPADTTVEIGLHGAVPASYIASEPRRIEAYRRIGAARTPAQIDDAEKDLASAYGPPPRPVTIALELARLRIDASARGVRSIALHEHDVILRCEDAAKIAGLLRGVQGTVRTITPRPGDSLQQVYFRPPPSWLEPESLLTVLRKRFAEA